MNEDSNDKTKVPDEFIFRRVSLVCFTTELDDKLKLIYNLCTGKLIIKPMAACVHAHELLGLCFFLCLSPLFCSS